MSNFTTLLTKRRELVEIDRCLIDSIKRTAQELLSNLDEMAHDELYETTGELSEKLFDRIKKVIKPFLYRHRGKVKPDEGAEDLQEDISTILQADCLDNLTEILEKKCKTKCEKIKAKIEKLVDRYETRINRKFDLTEKEAEKIFDSFKTQLDKIEDQCDLWVDDDDDDDEEDKTYAHAAVAAVQNIYPHYGA